MNGKSAAIAGLSYHFQFLEKALQNACPIPFVLVSRVVATVIMISTAVKVVSVIDVLIIAVRELIRICVASIIGHRIIVISTCLRVEMLINSLFDTAPSVRVRMVEASTPGIWLFVRISAVLRLEIAFEAFVLVVVLPVRVQLRDFLHAPSHNCRRNNSERKANEEARLALRSPFLTSSTDNPSGVAHRNAKISEAKPPQRINKQIKMHFIFVLVCAAN
jgi:hypothetical protein